MESHCNYSNSVCVCVNYVLVEDQHHVTDLFLSLPFRRGILSAHFRLVCQGK